jgi:hypothetical protein
MRGARPAAAATCALLAAIALAGCGGGGSAPAAPASLAPVAAPLPPAPLAAGDLVIADRRTPRAVTRALSSRSAVVVTFVMPGIAEDDLVARSLHDARAAATGKVSYFTFRVDQPRRFGDLPDLLSVKMTPTVVVIGRDHRLLNVWRGPVDATLLGQSIAAAVARPIPATPRPRS